MSKQVKIVGLSISKKLGALKATELTFDEKNRLTVIKGEVGAGKSTFNKAMRLTTQGSSALRDKTLYGDIEATTQLKDGETSIFVGCRSNKDGGLDYFLYSVNEEGEKVNDVVIDGVKATPANYLKSLQTALTWRLDELTSENQSVHRKILLEIYARELQKHGVIFDKNHPEYPKSVIGLIDKAKQHRNYLDMKRKEVGGIADDLNKKGIDFEERRKEKDISKLEKEVRTVQSKISIAETNLEQQRKNELTEIKLEAAELVADLKDWNNNIIKDNERIDKYKVKKEEVEDGIDYLIKDNSKRIKVKDLFLSSIPEIPEYHEELEFDASGKIISKAKAFRDYGIMYDAMISYKKLQKKYKKLKKAKLEAATETLEEDLQSANEILLRAEQYNKESIAVNSFIDWQEANDEVKMLQSNYYMQLTKVGTGVKGLEIRTDSEDDESDANIYLMYNGEYDKTYFSNKKKEFRKLSSYSGTQRPMICLLIQNHLLSKKKKTLPYLWIDDVPIDKKTKVLLERMSEELGLWLFVTWTGDFKAKNLKNGEILLENGEILMK